MFKQLTACRPLLWVLVQALLDEILGNRRYFRMFGEAYFVGHLSDKIKAYYFDAVSFCINFEGHLSYQDFVGEHPKRPGVHLVIIKLFPEEFRRDI